MYIYYIYFFDHVSNFVTSCDLQQNLTCSPECEKINAS